jgi:hypothetical protein
MPTLHYTQPTPRRFRLATLFPCLALPLLWLAAIGLFWEILFPAALVAIALLAARKQLLPILLLTFLFSPFTLFFANGVSDYAIATGRLRTHGLTRIDPASRLETRSAGDALTGAEWIRDLPYNAALRTMVKAFGPMRGTYTGPFPDQPTAYASLGAATPIDLPDLAADHLTLAGRNYFLAPGVGPKLLQGFRQGPASDIHNENLLKTYGPARALLYKPTLLLLAIPAGNPALPGDTRVLILIDLSRGTPIADYHDQPEIQFARYVTWR